MTVIEANTISEAWAGAFLHLIEQPGGVGMALAVEVTGLSNATIPEAHELRRPLDAVLATRDRLDCEGVANTIFPQTLWNPTAPRVQLYDRYERIWPAIRRHRRGGHMPNKRGTYFRRFTAFDVGGERVNQLEHVIETWQQHNRRHSALQVSVFHPGLDHVHNPRLGFPCLQQVSFTPLGPKGREGLSVTGFYPTQYCVEKAYGNYLGLARLGQFMAHEMGLELRSMRCIAVKPQLGDWPKKDLGRLRATVEGILAARKSGGDGSDGAPPDATLHAPGRISTGNK